LRIEILIDPRTARRWHWRLCDRLMRQADCSVRLCADHSLRAYPASVELLLSLEKLLLRRNRPSLADRTSPPVKLKALDESRDADVVLDLTGAEEASPGKAPLILRPLYDGSSDERTAVAALLSGSFRSVAWGDVKSGAIVAQGFPSLESMDGLTAGLEAAYARLTALIVQALASPLQFRPVAWTAKPELSSTGPAGFFLHNMAYICARSIYNLCCHAPHWHIGWRTTDGPGVLETGRLAGRPWNILPDVGDAFSADPFPIEWRGQSYIFFERLEYRSGKGAIFAQRLDENGPAGAPFLVLEEPWHLSYPLLIVEQGELFMLPEASVSGSVTLYRCVEFPAKWECVSHLLMGIDASDATIFRHDGLYWMTSTVHDGFGGYSDTLAIHHSPQLLHGWEQHAQNPLLIDVALARPAGNVVKHDGSLWRPVQDCSTGYGKRLALVRIDKLDRENFAQTRMNLLSPGPEWTGTHLHTLNRWGRLECIDGAGVTPKSERLRQLVQKR